MVVCSVGGRSSRSECLAADGLEVRQLDKLVISQLRLAGAGVSLIKLLAELLLHFGVLRKEKQDARQSGRGRVRGRKYQSPSRRASIIVITLKGGSYVRHLP